MSFPRRCQPSCPWSRSTQLHPLSGRVDSAPHSHLKQRSRRLEARKRQGRSSAQVDSAPHSHLRQRAEGWERLREFAQTLFALPFHNHRREKTVTGLCSGRVSFTLSSQSTEQKVGGEKRQRRGYAHVDSAPYSHLRQSTLHFQLQGHKSWWSRVGSTRAWLS